MARALNQLSVCCPTAGGAPGPGPQALMAAEHPRRRGMRGTPAPSTAPLLPGSSSLESGEANSPRNPPTGAGFPRARRERDLKPPGQPVRSARPRRPRAARLAPGSPRCLLAAMGLRSLLRLLPPVLAALGGLGGSATGEWGPRVGRPGRDRIPLCWLRGAGLPGCRAGAEESLGRPRWVCAAYPPSCGDLLSGRARLDCLEGPPASQPFTP